ncbi:MAG TPA: acetate--CoA ligase family protein [Actinomycetota bacterium]|nr:acetate--CoA ligase family protein [Actinomycetota bacterium]
MNLRPLLAPRSIAIVGASESPDSWAPEIFRSLQHLGYPGELYPVNPKYDEVWGRPCLSSVLELPKAGVDLAVVVIPASVAVRAVEESCRAGVRAAMVVSSGFGEAGPEGMNLQDELRAIARRHRMPILGPNVEGFVNYVDRVAPYGTTPPPEPIAGTISVISQSGTVAWTMGQMASDRGLGVRIILGVGNEAVIGLGDMFAWAAADPHTAFVVTYVETMRDVEGIGRGLDALRAVGKPVLMCAPAGRSEAAQRSIVAHTGALAGDAAPRDAWLRAHGATLMADPVEMFEAAVLLSSHRRLRASGVAAALQSGGACTLFAEAAAEAGLELPELSAGTRRRLRAALPTFAGQNNPLDVTGQAAVETEMYVAALEALADDPSVGFVAFDAFPPRLESEGVWAEPVLARVRELQQETGVCFASVAMSPLSYGKAARAFVDRAGIPFVQGHRAAAGAVRALVDLQDAGERSAGAGRPHPNRGKALRVLRGMAGPLDELRAAELLELYGVRRPAERAVDTPEEAGRAARAVGFPVAVKALAPEMPHKERLGGIRLGLVDAAAVTTAAAEVMAAALRSGARHPQVLVQRMVRGTEVLVGAVVDERFGPAVTIRPGGALAEAGEATFIAAPLTRRQAWLFVERHAQACGLDPRADDLAAAARAVEGIARAAADLRGRLASLEANPLIVRSRGAVAVDALAEARPPA